MVPPAAREKKGSERFANHSDAVLTLTRFCPPHASKRFYTARDKKGKNPKVVSGTLAEPAQAKAKGKREPKPDKPERLPKKFIAGMLLRRHGLEANLDELDKLAGTDSPMQTRFDLQHTHNAIRGWLAADAK